MATDVPLERPPSHIVSLPHGAAALAGLAAFALLSPALTTAAPGGHARR